MLYMSPSFTVGNFGNLRLADTELISYILDYPSACAEITHFDNICFGDFSMVVLRTWTTWTPKYSAGMKLVLRWCYIFEIIYAIICSLSIFMIDLMANRWKRSDECGQNEAMYWKLLFTAIPIKAHAYIAIFSRPNADTSWFSFTPIAPRSNAAHIAKIANFIKFFISNYRIPSFHVHHNSMAEIGL